MPETHQASARWRALWWLTAVVLAIHIGLLAGGWAGWPDSTTPTASGAAAAAAPPSPSGPPAPVVETRTNVNPVIISSVRWIVPQPPPMPDATRPAIGPRQGPDLPAADLRNPRPSGVAQNPSAPTTSAPSEPDPSNAADMPKEVPGLQQGSSTPPLDNTPRELAPALATDPASAPDAMVVAAAPTINPAFPPSAPRTSSLPPAQPPGPADLRYEIDGRAKGLRYSADAHLRWKPSGNRYTAELQISAFLVGNRVQTSRGRLDAQGLAPERFGDRRRNTEKATHFDPASQRIRYSSNAPDTPLLPGAQDRLSVFLQLAALFQARPDGYAAGQALRLQVAGTHDADTWTFQIGPEESLTLPAGTLQARRLTRPPQGEHDNTVDIWLAPELQYLPVRIRITEPDGDMADQKLRQRPP